MGDKEIFLNTLRSKNTDNMLKMLNNGYNANLSLQPMTEMTPLKLLYYWNMFYTFADPYGGTYNAEMLKINYEKIELLKMRGFE